VCARFEKREQINSGGASRQSWGRDIREQFERAGIQHEPACRDYPIAQQAVSYDVPKLAAMAELS
jgi:hypothetical protein